MTPKFPERLAAALAERYRIERELGAGGMATVYLAQDLKHDRKVALKVLKPELAAVLGAERFVVEIKTTASLQHPHILPLFDSGAAEGFLYYVMPFIAGETLRSRLERETQLGIDEAVKIAANVADALDYAHRQGVIHRDIKPENILLHDGRPMVADFGIALAVSAAAGGRMTETGLSLGTPHYMSPEQATAEKDISARSDIYSLGSVLYEMLTGQPPHLGGSAQQIIMKIITDEAAPVTKLRKSVPPNVAAAVQKSLEKLPADRFDSAKAFADALGNPGFTTQLQAGAGAGLGSGVSPRAFWAVAAVALLAILAAAFGWLRPTLRPEISRFAITLPDSQALVAGGFSGRLALPPDGRTIVYAGGDAAGQSRLWARRLDELNARPLPGTEGAINPAFSPDGRQVAFVTLGTPRALRTVTLAGGPALTLTDSLVDLGGVSWGNDGYIYYDAHLGDDGLARIRETGGRPEVASTPNTAAGESWHASPAALPSGRGVLFSIARRRGLSLFDVGVLDTRTGQHKVLARGTSARYADSGHLLFVTDDGTLMAAPFDAASLTLTGVPVPVAEGVSVSGLGRADVAVSRTGLLAYVAGAVQTSIRELVWVDRSGKETQVDEGWTLPIAGRPALSPDGKSALVSQGGQGPLSTVWVKQLDRGPASKLADLGAAPTWHPGGTQVLFTTEKGGAVGPADGSVLPTEFRSTRAVMAADYSHDGKWIVFTSAGDLYAMPSERADTQVRTLVQDPGNQLRPAVSPDGRWLAYSSDESGRPEVYVRPFPETARAKRQVSVGGGTNLRWSRDGRELFFVDDRRDLMVVSVTLTPTFSAGTPRRLFSGDPFGMPRFGFDVAPDGKRFLMSRPVGGGAQAPEQLVIVQNVFEELTAKARKQ